MQHCSRSPDGTTNSAGELQLSVSPANCRVIQDPEQGHIPPRDCELRSIEWSSDQATVREKSENSAKASSFAPSSLLSADSESWTSDLEGFELPAGYIHRLYQWWRWTLFSSYRRLFTIVFLANLATFLALGAKTLHHLPGLRIPRLDYFTTLSATAVNLTVSILVRNEHIVNALFLVSTLIGLSMPLTVRRCFAKIYEYGGIHSGCATAALVWYLGFAALVGYHSAKPPFIDAAIKITTGLNVLALLTIMVFAVPVVRARIHDWFECVHRFAGWIVVALFWTQTILMAERLSKHENTTITAEIRRMPASWCLCIITVCVAYPWTRLRQRPCVAQYLSPHAMRLDFAHSGVSHCSAIRLATNPLKATHAFAAIPSPSEDKRGFSVIVSNAGDWTSQLIKNPPQKIWTKGAPFHGVLRVAIMFKPVLIVATGSGIGPCLSLFHGVPELDCCVLWSAQSPYETYGSDIIQDVLEADAGAVIIDTKRAGRPDLLRLTYEMCKTKHCEAVVVISNSSTTREVVHGMEIRGTPAFGPIFDS